MWVVRDTPGLLVTYLAEGTEFTFPPSPLPHPWGTKKRWEGHGTLMLQRPGEMHAIFVFCTGPTRDFAGWYVNIQEPFRRTASGELDAGRRWWDDGWASWSP